MSIDYQLVEKLGMEVFLTVSIFGLSAWLVRTIIKMGEKHLAAVQQGLINVMERHEKERDRWHSQYDKISDKTDRAMKYQREEHAEMMKILYTLSTITSIAKEIQPGIR